jgi:hypothetical protein
VLPTWPRSLVIVSQHIGIKVYKELAKLTSYVAEGCIIRRNDKMKVARMCLVLLCGGYILQSHKRMKKWWQNYKFTSNWLCLMLRKVHWESRMDWTGSE